MKHLWKIWKLWNYYHLKRKTVLVDMHVPWVPNLQPRRDIGRHQFVMNTDSGHRVIVTVIGADRFIRSFAIDAQLDITGIQGERSIRQCTFKEFRTLYGDWILDVRPAPF